MGSRERTLTSAQSDMALRRMPAGFATSEQIYNDILCKELLAHLNPIEQQIAKGKSAGHSDDEIARGCGTSCQTIFNAWRRLKRKMRGVNYFCRYGRSNCRRAEDVEVHAANQSAPSAGSIGRFPVHLKGVG
jgi:DNA-binding NarL/FixJ family response regulator